MEGALDIRMALRKTSVAIDDDLARRVQEELGTPTLRATIQASFVETLRARARAREIRRMRELRGLDLADPDVMRGSWVHDG